jgi:para-nitrobenzyl esterase
MLFGQSAGAIDSCALLASPLAHGLFSSVLMESGNCAAESLESRYARSATIATASNCAHARDVVACLQGAPLSSLLLTGGGVFAGAFAKQVWTKSTDASRISDLPFGPTVDGYVLEDTPEATLEAGKHNHVPLVIGTNAREVAFHIPSFAVPNIPIASCAEYAAIVGTMFPGLAAQLLTKYPCNPLDRTAGYRQLIAVATDAFFTCPSRRALRAAAATQVEPVYRYLFTHGNAKHTDELFYVFDTFASMPLTPTPAESALSQQMQSYWFNFAASGNPNGAGLPYWNAYDPRVDNALELDTPIGETSGIDAAGCNFWDTVQ